MNEISVETLGDQEDPLRDTLAIADSLWNQASDTPDSLGPSAFEKHGIVVEAGTDEVTSQDWISFTKRRSPNQYQTLTLTRSVGSEVDTIQIEEQRPSLEDEGFGRVVRSRRDIMLSAEPPIAFLYRTIGRPTNNDSLRPEYTGQQHMWSLHPEGYKDLTAILRALSPEHTARRSFARRLLGALGVGRSTA